MQNVTLGRLHPLFKRNMERHSECFGDTLQLLNGRVYPATTDTVQILVRPANPSGQLPLTHLFFDIAFFMSIFVVLFIYRSNMLFFAESLCRLRKYACTVEEKTRVLQHH